MDMSGSDSSGQDSSGTGFGGFRRSVVEGPAFTHAWKHAGLPREVRLFNTFLTFHWFNEFDRRECFDVVPYRSVTYIEYKDNSGGRDDSRWLIVVVGDHPRVSINGSEAEILELTEMLAYRCS